jgi:glycosyltransferase involved in cell wall biosynthesis
MKPTILIIQPGPSYKTDSPKIEILGERFDGAVLTTSNDDRIVAAHTAGPFEFHCLRIKSYDGRLCNMVRYLWFCVRFCVRRRFVERKRIDLVTTYDPLKTGLIGVVASRLLSACLVPEVNGSYASHYNYLDRAPRLSRVYAFIYTQVMKVVLTFSHGIKYQYPGQIAFFDRWVGARPVGVFPNLVSLEAFRHISEEKEVLIVGFPFWRKGIDVAISAFKLIADDFPDWTLKILGWYPDLGLLNGHIAGHPRIHHHEAVPQSEMPGHVGCCAMLCCPSRSEGVPRVLMEAMMAGKPRIGSRVDGIPVVIQDGYDGFLFANEDHHELSQKMVALMRDSDLRATMGRRGRERVLREFSRERYSDQLVSLYLRVLERARPQTSECPVDRGGHS